MTSSEDIALRPLSNGFDWGRVFRRYTGKGFDHGYAAHKADEAQRRYARSRKSMKSGRGQMCEWRRAFGGEFRPVRCSQTRRSRRLPGKCPDCGRATWLTAPPIVRSTKNG